MARSAYTYFHIPMIAGIIAVAASDELTGAHPGENATIASVALILGGTALFLAGHALFKWTVFGTLSWSHIVAIAVLIALIPLGFEIPTLALSSVTALVVFGLAVWDPWSIEDACAGPPREVTNNHLTPSRTPSGSSIILPARPRS